MAKEREINHKLNGTPLDQRPYVEADTEKWHTERFVTFPKSWLMTHPQPPETQPQEEPEAEASVFIDSDGAWLQTPKDDAFLEAFKMLVPWSGRAWVFLERSWFVTEEYSKNATELVKLFFADVEVKDLRANDISSD